MKADYAWKSTLVKTERQQGRQSSENADRSRADEKKSEKSSPQNPEQNTKTEEESPPGPKQNTAAEDRPQNKKQIREEFPQNTD